MPTPTKEEHDLAARAELDRAIERSRGVAAVLQGCVVVVDLLKARDTGGVLDRLREDTSLNERRMTFYGRTVTLDLIDAALLIVFLRRHLREQLDAVRVLDLGAGRLAHHLPSACPGALTRTREDASDEPIDLAFATWCSRDDAAEVAKALDRIVALGASFLFIVPPFDQYEQSHPLVRPVLALAHRAVMERVGFRLVVSEPKYPPGCPGFEPQTMWLFEKLAPQVSTETKDEKANER
jgi:hypothetical protein